MKKTNIGLVGCGVISKVYLSNIKKFFHNLDVVACADIDAKKAEETAAEFDIATVYSVDEILEAKEVDIILNLTIPAVHYDLNKKAILKGKNVYCEKPLALSVDEAEELVELAKEKGVMLGCAPDSFLGAGIQTCIQLINEGKIGTPIAATANMLNHGVETWHPSPDFFYKQGGGPMMDMGPYYITALVAMLGPVKKTASMTTTGFAARKIYSRPRNGEEIKVEVPTHYTGILEFDCGVVANVTMSFDTWLTNLPKLEIYGTEGTLVVPDPNQFNGTIKLVRGEELIAEIDNIPNSEAIGKLSRPKMWEKYKEIPSLFEQPDKNMRGIGLADMAGALEHHRANRASAKLACHVTEVLSGLSKEGEFKTMKTSCDRPEAMKVDKGEGRLD